MFFSSQVLAVSPPLPFIPEAAGEADACGAFSGVSGADHAAGGGGTPRSAPAPFISKL
jgi:hypothetical protein